MVALTARQYHDGDFAALLELIARNAAARAPGRTCLMNSDLVWQFYGSAPEENIRLWYDGDRLLAYGWFQPPFELKLDVHTAAGGDARVLDEILAFGEQRRVRFGGSYPFFVDVGFMAEWREALARPTPAPEGPRCLMVSALESDVTRSDWLIAQGFERIDHYEPVLLQELGGGSTSAVGSGRWT